MRQRPILLTLLFLLCFTSLHADSVKGIVVDEETGQPLSGATVEVVNSGDGWY